MALSVAPTLARFEAASSATRPGGFRANLWSVLPPLALGTGAFVVYLWTMAPTLTWNNGGADGAELAAAAYVWGVAHPPGYPLYLTLIRLAQLVPVGDVAYRAAVFSAVSASCAAVVVSATVAHVASAGAGTRWWMRAAALFAGASFALGPLLWSQAVVTEVYTFGSLLLGLFLLALVRWLEGPTHRRTLALFGSLALLISHQPTFAVALLPIGLLAWRRRLPPRVWLQGAAALLLVPLLLLTLWVRASFHPALNWGDPSTLDRWLALVTAASYHAYFLSRPALAELPRVPYAVTLLVRQAGWLAILLAVLGLIWLSRARRAFALVAVALAGFFVGFAVLYNAQDGEVYLLPAIEVLAVAAGVGASWVLETLPALARSAGLLALLVSLTWQLGAGWHEVDASHDTRARDWGVAALEQAPRDGTLRTRTDDETFVLWYLQAVDGLRPDVVVIEERLLPAAWYRQQLVRQHTGRSLTLS